MPRWFRNFLIFLAILIPSAQFAWRNRDMPQFAYMHDDGVFFVSAQSLAAGQGFRIPSLPETPAQTKYPVLYPAYLALVWLLNPSFPANLALATLASWLALAACLALAFLYYRAAGLSGARAWVLTGLAGLSPYVVLFGASMFSEIFFTCFVLGCFLAARREGMRAAVLAGVLGGAAYLARTAGLALFVAVPAWMLWRREARRAGAFAAAMFPAIAGWTLWTRARGLPAADETLVYYTDYVRYQFLNVGWDDLPLVLWNNADQILYGLGSLVLPKVFDSLPVKIVTEVIAVAMIAGVVRLARRGMFREYACFAAASLLLLLPWHYPPTERFVLPLYPLAIAGLAEELERLAAMIRAALRHRDASQRAAARVFGAGAAALLAAALGLQVFMTFSVLHESAAEKRAKRESLRPAWEWIAAHVPAGAAVLSYDDALTYLYAGRRGNYLPILPKWWYRAEHARIVGTYDGLAAYCRSRDLSFVLATPRDLERETNEDDRAAIARKIETAPGLRRVARAGIATLYAVEPAPVENARR
jgi:hypothetical protein